MAEPTYLPKNAKDLNQFLCGVLKDLRSGNLTSEQAQAISVVADKINKNNVNILVHKKLTGHKGEIEFFEDNSPKTEQ